MKADEAIPDCWQKMVTLIWGVINEIAEECFHDMTYQVPIKFTPFIQYRHAKRMWAAQSARKARGDGGFNAKALEVHSQGKGKPWMKGFQFI